MADGFGKWVGLAMAGKRNPWGKGSGDGEEPTSEPSGDAEPTGESGESADDKPANKPKGPRNPWLPPAPGGDGEGKRRTPNIEEIFRSRGPEGPRRTGGPDGPNFRFPTRPGGGSWFPIAIAAIVGLWLIVSSVHQVAPREQGVVTWMGGKYSRTLNPGLNFTLPWPLHVVTIENVSQIRSVSMPDSNNENLILTGDQNLVDLSYLIRWSIKDLRNFRFQQADPDDTIREVAEAAMRASVAEHDLDSVLSGEGRADIEARVRTRMQDILDGYRAGVAVQGIEIVKTGPPEQVVDAFNDVSAAQQDAETAVNSARAYAQRVLARAQGDATAFDKIYAEYRLAPEVTRQRLYYETMESVLGKTDKTIVETDGVQTYLPLSEIQRRTRSASNPPAAPATPREGQ